MKIFSRNIFLELSKTLLNKSKCEKKLLQLFKQFILMSSYIQKRHLNRNLKTLSPTIKVILRESTHVGESLLRKDGWNSLRNLRSYAIRNS